ncbi:hypothetical protein MHBO_002023 [Bonamia ostreae]|uniref:HECT-type E3 ubiquitin transferase n=1 Tax=Bonamia ostreae TaxID=126728 RepID=A0ABV2AKZ4_9EUKA
MIDLSFPRAFYKHLLNLKDFSFDDFKQIFPEVARSLKSLLEFEGNVEETFCRQFEVSYEWFGKEETAELIPEGSKKVVTNENREEFVDLYVQWHLQKVVAKKMKFIKKGFDRICRSKEQWVLDVLTADELNQILCGTSQLNFIEWKSKTTLTGYKWTDNVIRNFWQIIQNFDNSKKIRLLSFVTGSVRAPIGGLSVLPLRIIKGASTEMFLIRKFCCFRLSENFEFNENWLKKLF